MSSKAAVKRSAGSLLEELGYLPEEQAADVIDVIPKTLAEYRKQQIGPEFTVVGRRIYYAKEALAKWLAAGGSKNLGALALALALLFPSPSPARDLTTISGASRVVDGDTVVVAGVHVRLKGVDAAELRTPRGEMAKQTMIAIVHGEDLTCTLTGELTWRREVGYCVTAGGVDINRTIIEQGAALACPRYDQRYLPFETAAALAAQTRAAYCVKR